MYTYIISELLFHVYGFLLVFFACMRNTNLFWLQDLCHIGMAVIKVVLSSIYFPVCCWLLVCLLIIVDHFHCSDALLLFRFVVRLTPSWQKRHVDGGGSNFFFGGVWMNMFLNSWTKLLVCFHSRWKVILVFCTSHFSQFSHFPFLLLLQSGIVNRCCTDEEECWSCQLWQHYH